MSEPLDERLRDDEVLDEIDLTTDLMIAATESEGPLEQSEVDHILGLD
ncbi:MAG: hypothetical protein JWP10_506 [Nocardioidaceae bacterium]|nr:hypothetical protein [Nocardioidaceae bacterium]